MVSLRLFFVVTWTLSRALEQVEELTWYTMAVARNIEGHNVTNKYLDIHERTLIEGHDWLDECCEGRLPCFKICTSCKWETSLSSCMKIRVVPRNYPEPFGYDYSSTECLHLFKLEEDFLTHGDIDLLSHHRRETSRYTRPKFPRVSAVPI